MCGTLSIASKGSSGTLKKVHSQGRGPEVTEQEDNYQKQEVKQYLIELVSQTVSQRGPNGLDLSLTC